MPTQLPPPASDATLYLVDLSGYVFRAYHALPPMSSADGEPTHAVYGVTRMLNRLFEDQAPVLRAVALDPSGPSFRKELYSEYKANRPPSPPDLRSQIDRIEEIVEAMGIPVLKVPGYEADDVIATVVTQANALGWRVVVVTADKDLLQLVQHGNIVYDTSKSRVYGPEEVRAKMGVAPEQVSDYLALTGDTSDNIPGVPSVGPKTAAKLLGEYESFDGVFAHVEDIKRKSLKAKLIEFRSQAELSKSLVGLRRDVPITLDETRLRPGQQDVERLTALYKKLAFHRLLADLDVPQAGLESVTVVRDVEQLEEVLTHWAKAEKRSFASAVEGEDALRGELVGIALGWGEQDAAYLPLGHLSLTAGKQLPEAEVVSRLRPWLEDGSCPLRVVDSKFEQHVWRRYGVTLRGVVCDCLLASYLVDAGGRAPTLAQLAEAENRPAPLSYDVLSEKKGRKQRALRDLDVLRVADWAGRSAHLACVLADNLLSRVNSRELNALFQEIELPLARVLSEMEQVGIEVSVETLRGLAESNQERSDALVTQAHALVGREFNINSPRVLEGILFDELELPVIKKTKTARSTDQDVLNELRSHHALPDVVLEYRMLTKLRNTYLEALPREIQRETGRIHSTFNQTVAATGRISSSRPNLQNIPIRTSEGREIRSAFVARQGWSLLSADYSQVELRVLAHLSQDEALVGAFAKDVDVHVRTAMALFDVEENNVTKDMRGQAKTVNYAVLYGQTQFALARNLGISRSEAKRYIDAFFSRYEGVARFMDGVVAEAQQQGGVKTLMGRWRALPNIKSRNRALRTASERMAKNTPIQGSSADLLKLAMIRIQDKLRGDFKSQMLLTVHDELVFEVAPGEEAMLERFVRTEMEGVATLAVPLVVDIGRGQTWREAH